MQDVENVRASRGSLPTVPESGQTKRDVDEDRPSIPLDKPRLTWAVAVGDSDVRAMSTFDLWRALSTGELSHSVSVWRVGRECWSPAIEVPELACALRVSLHEVPIKPEEDDGPRITVDYIAAPPGFGLESDDDLRATALPRLRLSLPEMFFSPDELSRIEAEARQVALKATGEIVGQTAVDDLAPAPAVEQESPSSELPQAVVLPPRESQVELDAERPTVLPTRPRKPRSRMWLAAAAALGAVAMLGPAVGSDASGYAAALDGRATVAAQRASDLLAHGPQAQARVEGSMSKIVIAPKPPKKPVAPSKKGQKRRSRVSAR
jgi:hypothetical protein